MHLVRHFAVEGKSADYAGQPSQEELNTVASSLMAQAVGARSSLRGYAG